MAVKDKIHINQILVENHELREKNRQQAEELQTLQHASDIYKKKMEAEKVSLLRRLAVVNESLELALVEKRDLKEKMGRSEKNIDEMQVNIKELMNVNITLSEELRQHSSRPSTPTNPHSTSSTSSPGPSSPVMLNSPPSSFRPFKK